MYIVVFVRTGHKLRERERERERKIMARNEKQSESCCGVLETSVLFACFTASRVKIQAEFGKFVSYVAKNCANIILISTLI
jgi:hypothetical protein